MLRHVPLLLDGPTTNNPSVLSADHGLEYRKMLIQLVSTAIQALGEQSRKLLPHEGNQDLTGPTRSSVTIHVLHANNAGADVSDDEERLEA